MNVTVKLLSNVGSYGIVTYEGRSYFIELGTLEHISDDTYTIDARLLTDETPSVTKHPTIFQR
jgi:hypothetical protein